MPVTNGLNNIGSDVVLDVVEESEMEGITVLEEKYMEIYSNRDRVDRRKNKQCEMMSREERKVAIIEQKYLKIEE
jgi:hypothetical protein